MNAAGSIIYQKSISSAEPINIETGSFASGLYILKITTSGGTVIKKLVK